MSKHHRQGRGAGRRQTLAMWALEPRYLFDAAVVAGGAEAMEQVAQAQAAQAVAAPGVDTSTETDTLLAALAEVTDPVALPLLANGPGAVTDDPALWLRADDGAQTFREELLTNPGFDDGATGWTTTGNIDIASSLARFNGSNREANGTLEQTVTTTAGELHELQATLLIGGGGTAEMGVRVDIIDAATDTVITTRDLTATQATGAANVHLLSFTPTGTQTTVRFTDISTATAGIDALVTDTSLGVVTAAADGEAVVRWADRGGLGSDFGQTATDQRPVHVADGLNFNPLVRFDGANDVLRSQALVTALDGATDYEIYIVARNDNATKAGFLLSTSDSRSGVGVLAMVNANGTARFVHRSPTGATGGDEVTQAPYDVDNAQLFSFRREAGVAQSIAVNSGDATTISAPSADPLDARALAAGLGAVHETGSFGFEGGIAEVLVHTRTLSEAERDRVESYLGLKYGLTLADGYVDSAGNALPTFADGVDQQIAGIGLDTSGSLDQRRSRSSVGEAAVTVGGASDLDDREFLLWANDGADVGGNEVFDIGGETHARLSRTWQFSETGDVGSVEVTFDTRLFPTLSIDANRQAHVIVADDADFTTNVRKFSLGDAPGVLTASGVEIDHGDYFTLGTDLPETPVTVNFALPDNRSDEATGGEVTLLVSAGFLTSPTTIDVVAVSGTASAADLVATTTTVTIPAGAYFGPVEVAVPAVVADDGIVEAEESVALELRNPGSGAVVGDDAAHALTVVDDDRAEVAFVDRQTRFFEGESPAIDVRLTFTPTTGAGSLAAGQSVTVDVSYGAASSATNDAAGDLVLDVATLSIAGGGISAPLPFTLRDDADGEAGEDAEFDIALAAGNLPNVSLGEITRHTMRIVDNDLAVTVEQAPDQRDPTPNLEIRYRITFDDPIDPATFTADDLVVSGSLNEFQVSAPVDVGGGDGTAFEVTVTDYGDGETITMSLPENTVVSAASADQVNAAKHQRRQRGQRQRGVLRRRRGAGGRSGGSGAE